MFNLFCIVIYVSFEEEDEYGWGDFVFDAAIVAVPMALVLAAMPTGLFTIPIVGSVHAPTIVFSQTISLMMNKIL